MKAFKLLCSVLLATTLDLSEVAARPRLERVPSSRLARRAGEGGTTKPEKATTFIGADVNPANYGEDGKDATDKGGTSGDKLTAGIPTRGNTNDDKKPRVLTGKAQSRFEIEVLDKIKYGSNFEVSSFLETNLNYGDTGLLAELIYNRAFQTAKDAEFTQAQSDQLGSGSLVGWNAVGQVNMEFVLDNPVSQALPASAKLTFDQSVQADNSGYKGYFGIKNRGFWGIPARSGEQYTASWYMRADKEATVDVQYGLFDHPLATQFGGASDRVQVGPVWKQVKYTFTPTKEAPDLKNVFAIVFDGTKGEVPPIQINLVSVFPQTWKDTVIRQDGAQALLDFRPRSFRSPGGNDLSGFSPASRFRWNNTLGPMVDRPGRAGNWAGWNTEALGVVELYNFITELGAELIVGLFAGTYNGETSVTSSQMGPIVQDQVNFLRFLLDEDGEFAEARVKAGGPKKPYRVDAVMIGNESGLTAPNYQERYSLMESGIKKQFFAGDGKYPAFDIIATAPVKVKKGRRNLDTLNNPLYGTPKDFIAAYHRYDQMERDGTIHYNLEFSAINSGLTEDDNIWSGSSRLEYTTLQSSLAEGVFLLGLERNGDICAKAAYAPQMASHADNKLDQSTPGQLIFDPAHVVKSSSYLVMQAFGRYHVTDIHDVKVAPPTSPGNGSSAATGGSTNTGGSSGNDGTPQGPTDILEENLIYHSAGSDKDGRIILKMVNYDAQPKLVDIRVYKPIASVVQYIVTGQNPQGSNTLESPDNVQAHRVKVDTANIHERTVTVTLRPYSMNAIAVK